MAPVISKLSPSSESSSSALRASNLGSYPHMPQNSTLSLATVDIFEMKVLSVLEATILKTVKFSKN